MARAIEDEDPEGARSWAVEAESLAAQKGQTGDALRAEARSWLEASTTTVAH